VPGGRLIELFGRQPDMSEGFVQWLSDADCSILLLAGGHIWAVGLTPAGRVHVADTNVGQTLTALCVSPDGLDAAGWQVWRWVDALAGRTSDEGHDRIYLPQSAFTVGDVGVVDLASLPDGLTFASSRMGCLASLHERWSFNVTWTPAWQSALAADDRCHLSGFTMDDAGRIWVAVAGRTDEPGGWRAGRVGGGCVVSTGDEVLCDGLTMPRAPRFFANKLLVPDTGSGRLLAVPIDGGGPEVVNRWTGAPSAVAVHDSAALVGLSSPRLRDFEDLPAFDGADVPINDALLVLDLSSGEEIGRLELLGRGNGISAIAVLPGVRWPKVAEPRGVEGRRMTSLAPHESLPL
jgi:protein O-GlcNAc transferase